MSKRLVHEFEGEPSYLITAYELIGRRVAGGWSLKNIAHMSGLKLKEVQHFEDHPNAAYLSTMQRYARAVGLKLELDIVEKPSEAGDPS